MVVGACVPTVVEVVGGVVEVVEVEVEVEVEVGGLVEVDELVEVSIGPVDVVGPAASA